MALRLKPTSSATRFARVAMLAQIAEFQKTLMGRISLTQPGKFSCENCHGPGSAHAKAGGGRGVGGIMSFEADDPRTSEEKNAICSPAISAATALIGRAASTKSVAWPA